VILELTRIPRSSNPVPGCCDATSVHTRVRTRISRRSDRWHLSTRCWAWRGGGRCQRSANYSRLAASRNCRRKNNAINHDLAAVFWTRYRYAAQVRDWQLGQLLTHWSKNNWTTFSSSAHEHQAPFVANSAKSGFELRRVPRIRKIGSLQVHTRYRTSSFKKPALTKKQLYYIFQLCSRAIRC